VGREVRRTHFPATVLILVTLWQSGCGRAFDYQELISTPINLGPEWTEIAPPASIADRRRQSSLFLELPEGCQAPDFEQVICQDGRSFSIEAVAVADDGTIFPLTHGGLLRSTKYQSDVLTRST
jgi:hypothetical protein